jgi:uncharacterized protein involved in exopolysaccharide biosynthesis
MSDNTPLDPIPTADAPSGTGAASAGSTVAPKSNGARHSAGYVYGYGSNVLGDSEIHLLDYVRVIYKRRWTAITVFLVVFVSVTIYAFTATPIYESKVQILIEKENANVVSFKEAFEQNQNADDYYQTQYKLLQSRALARRTLETLKLWTNPQFTPPPGGRVSITAMVLKPVVLVAGWFKAPRAGVPEPDETTSQSNAIDRFLAGLAVAPIRNSRLVDVKFASPDPALSAQVANTVAKGYIEQNLEFKFTSSKEASDWLGLRLGEQRKQVEASEQALQKYRERTDSVALEDKQNIVVQKLADLNTAVTRAKTERIQKEALYNQITSLQDDRAALDTFPAILTNTFIQQQKGELADLQRQQAQLSQKLGRQHPDMVKVGLAIQTVEAKLKGEIAKVVQSTRNDYQASQAQERSLVNALEQQKRDALELNRKGIDYGALQRDAMSNRQIFDGLMQRTKETGIAGEQRSSHIRIVDEAVSRGYDLRTFCREMMVHIRALLVVKIAGFDSELVQLPESEAETLRRLAESFSEQDLLRFFSILTKTEQDIRNSSQPRFQLEMGLVKLAQARRLFLLEEALGRIEALESRLSGAGASSPSSSGRAASAQRGPRPAQDPPRQSTTRAAAPPARVREGESNSENLQARPKLMTPAEHIAGSPAPTATAAGSAPVRPRAIVEPSPPPIGELYAVAQEATKPVQANTGAGSVKDSVEKLKDALEAKGKMRVVAALDKGTISIEGDYLRVTYTPENSSCKTEIEERHAAHTAPHADESTASRLVSTL